MFLVCSHNSAKWVHTSARYLYSTPKTDFNIDTKNKTYFAKTPPKYLLLYLSPVTGPTNESNKGDP